MRPLIRLPGRHGCVAMLAAVLAASGAGAAVVLESTDLLRLHAGGPAASASMLERALTIDTNTSQRNLNLLLEARRAGDVVSPVRAAVPPGQPASRPAGQARGALVPLGLQSQDSVTAPGAAERREWSGGAPARAQPGLPGSGSGPDGVGQDLEQPRRSGQGADAVERLPFLQWMDGARQFVRDNRFELLAGAGLSLVAVAGAQALARRR